MTASPDLVRAYTETYQMELSLGSNVPDAIEHAIAAVLVEHERIVTAEIANLAETHALGIDAAAIEAGALDEGYRSPEAAGMLWFADKLRKDLPPANYQPEADDLVQVTLTGRVEELDEICPNCGEKHDYDWVLVDDRTGDEYYFSRDPEHRPVVRRITKADQLAEQ